ncbi:MAG: Hsp20/alpha crystallin family protein [Desulfovibrio sp.]|nr:MAG: Hsp20/alpha crystallin family protein [Desulfovibrio sp.]
MVIDFNPFYEFNRHVGRLLDDYSSPLTFSRRRAAFPPINISEDDANLYVECEIPGLAIEDIEITLEDSSLTIKGELKPGEGKYYRQERASGLFNRVVSINTEIERDAVSAKLKDGVLEITLPKAEEVKPRTISIEAS